MTPEFLQKIKDAVNITDVVGEHVVLRKSGANFSGLCPFHAERTPSFSVSESKQLYHCYGCKRGGDLLSFVMEIHGIPFREAIEELADRARLALPKDWDGAKSSDPKVQAQRDAQREKTAVAQKLNRFAAHFFHQSLSKFPHAGNYFRARGMTDELAREFYVGIAPPSWDALASHLVAKKAPLPLAVELGLVRPSTKQTKPGGPGYFDLFRNRAIFPILNMRGKVAGFGGRALELPEGVADVGAQDPKYLNSAESFLFHKGRLLFGLYQAQKHVRELDQVILVEGYFDVIALHAAGFRNTVATCGTALTPDHLQMLRRFAGKIVILFDGDKAGVSATERAMEIGLQEGAILYGAAMPDGLDPDEVLFDQNTGKPRTGGIERMQAILNAARPILDERIEKCVEAAANGPEATTQAVKKIAHWLATFRDPVGREVRIQALQAKPGFSRGLLEKAIFGEPKPRHQSQKLQVAPGKTVPRRPFSPGRQAISQGDKILFTALVQGGDLASQLSGAQAKLPPRMVLADLFEHPQIRDLANKILVSPGNLEKLREFPDQLLDVSDPELNPELRALYMEAQFSENPLVKKEELARALDRGIGRAWARFSQGIKQALAEAEAKKDAELQAKLMKEYLDVQRRMKEFNSFYDEA